MPFEDTTILEFNCYQKFHKEPFNFYADLDCIVEKIDECKNNLGSSSTTKVSKDITSGFLMSTITSFRSIENNQVNICWS